MFKLRIELHLRQYVPAKLSPGSITVVDELFWVRVATVVAPLQTTSMIRTHSIRLM